MTEPRAHAPIKHNRSKFCLHVSALIAVLTFSPVLTTATFALDAEDEIVVSATRTPRPISEVGASVTVITAPDIELRQYQSVADIIRDTAGASIARTSSFGGLASARIRGSASGQSLVVIDGIVVNDPSAPSGGFNFANLDVVDIEQIEILRGPQSILYGADAIGGVVSITTKRASDEGADVSAFLEGGSFGFLRGGASLAGKGADADGRLTVTGTRTDGISRAANGIEDDGFRSIAASFTGGIDLSSDWRAAVFARFGDAHAEIDGFPPPSFVLADSDDTEDTQEYGLAAQLTQNNARFYQALTVSYANIARDNFSGGVFSFGADGDRLSAEYIARYEFSDHFAALAGIEGERTEVDVSGITESAKNGALFALFEISPFDAVEISAGVRHDEYEDFAGATTGRVTGAWQAGPNTIVRASWGQGFRAPSLFQVNFNLFGGPPNFGLQPEKSNAFDASVEQAIASNITAKVTLFHQKVRDQIDFDFTSGGYINIDRTRARGVEVEADWAFSQSISIGMNYTYLDAVDETTGAQLLQQPKHSGALFVDVAATDRLTLGASVIANGDEADIGVRNDAWVRVDARAAYALSDRLEVYGRIENAGDTDYQDVAGYREPGRSYFGGVRIKL